MYNKLKIKIAVDAYNELIRLLQFHNEYDCITFCPSDNSCCKSSKVEIILDNSRAGYISDSIDSLKIQYDNNLLLSYKEITVILSKGSFYIKAVPSSEILLSFKNKKNSCNKNKKPGM